jgi:HmuY protein
MKQICSTIIVAILLIATIASCRKKDALPTADNYVAFDLKEQGITAAENSIVVKIKLLNAATQDLPLAINVVELGVANNTDYTTLPAITAGKISLVVLKGSKEVSFILNKIPTAIFDGDEKIVFTISTSNTAVNLGVTKEYTLNFAEIVANNFSSTVNGGGVNFGNKVFVDISANRQTVVQRTNWDLNFYNGADDFRVTLNSSVNMMARQLNKTDLNTVNTNDTLGLTNVVAFSQFAPTTISLPYIDYPNGDLTRTAIATISTTAIDNKVYLINRGNAIGTGAASRGWKKIRILRSANGGYTLEYADITATTFSSIDIAKDDRTFFKQFSFENNIIDIEPAKKKWDFTWTYFANVTNFGGGEVPYLFQDVILINKNVQIAKVLTATKTFDNFSIADLPSLTYLTAQNAIATDWRSGGGPTSLPAVRTDRYYVLKDSDNNVYKIRFTALAQNNERGYPTYEAVLIKRG